MPFGSMYGAIFFTLLALWLLFAPPEVPEAFLEPHLFLAAVSGATGLALLLRLRWARWGGAALSAVVMLWTASVFQLAPGPGPVLFLVGSTTCGILLLLPVTGRATPASRGGAIGRAAAGVAVLGSVGFVAASLWVARAPAEAQPQPALRASPAESVRDRVRWTDFGRGIELAAGEGKPLVVTFVANWCGYCKKMDRTTWKDPRVIENLADLVAVRVDVEETSSRNGYSGADLAARYGVRGTPALMLLDAEGTVLARADGYRDAADTLAWLAGALRRLGGAPGDTRNLRTTAH